LRAESIELATKNPAVHVVLFLDAAFFFSLSRAWDDLGRTRPGNWHANGISVSHCCAQSGINRFLMKGLLLFFIMSAVFAHGLLASDSLPFPVSVGGQVAKDGTPFAKIENPVAADAELAVDSKSDMIIVNVNLVNAKNEPVQGSAPAVILLQGKTKTNLDKTMDGKKLPAGNYIMSVVSEGKTASIRFTIK
jgi:hypothetical protein